MTPEEYIKLSIQDKRDLGQKIFNFNAMDLASVDFTQCNLTGSSFMDTNLSGANFGRAKVENCDFENANLTNCNFSGAILEDAFFRRAIIYNTNFSYAAFQDAKFEKTGFAHLMTNRYNIYIMEDAITIGCQKHTRQEWRKFTDERIHRMDSNALEWWQAHKTVILSLARHYSKKP